MKALRRIYVNGRFAAQTLTGVQRYATELTAALQARLGDAATVLAPPGGAQGFAGAREVGRRGGQLWEQWELPRAARDGLLLNLGNTAPLRLRRQVLVIHDAGVFSTPEAYSKKFRLWYKTMQGMLVRRGTPIVTVSEFSRQEIIRHLGARDAQVQVMPEGADHVARILAAPEILALHGLRAGRYVLAVGTLAAHKNLRALGALAEALAAREVPLVIAGSLGGAAFGDGQALALPQPARYIGRVSDGALKALYEQAGCFVFPSRYEGFGLPVVEAMASGCPVVASGIPVLREICGPAGQFCDPLAPPDIAAKVLEVLDDADLAARLRAAGLARTRMLTWDAAAARLLDIIETVDRGGR